MTALFRLEALASQHDRSAFTSGDSRLDLYLQTQATQDSRRRIANCFVAVETATQQVVAYYTIASASVSTADLPPEDAKRLPRYPTMPAVRIGRLAVDRRYQGRGLGKSLLADAAVKAIAAAPASFALLVDAKDDQAVNFYKHHGFRQLVGMPRVLFLPLATAEKLLLA
ncbi:GNAT family N-acetyltransferase [Methylovulum psychrotolerans]|uniref:GNAT family N-acetyltransferase n=1 Tax=Methylovulum psychrotolerans TaxID=1704499 RepID=A0A1Z4BXR6_9GAMM|nr:GNAT family N-acetyltransferase [Methylovulum psychrotolerans]ASF46094.1 GNAT family N-acetyltransferase [Methylovulum psychrotolerans]